MLPLSRTLTRYSALQTTSPRLSRSLHLAAHRADLLITASLFATRRSSKTPLACADAISSYPSYLCCRGFFILMLTICFLFNSCRKF